MAKTNGTCQKIESLSDGSVKLSIYLNKEAMLEAVPLLYQPVIVSDELYEKQPEPPSEQFEAGKKEGIRIAHEAFVKYCEEQLKGDD